MYQITFARRWYEFTYIATQKRGLWRISCHCTDPAGYYCAFKSWELTGLDYDQMSEIMGL